MWGARYFARRFWALRYFPTGGVDVSAPASPNVITLTGSYVTVTTVTGSVLLAAISGSYAPITTLEGSA